MKPSMIARWIGDRRGAAAVEFALVTPFLAAVVIGIATLSPLLSASHKMRDGVSAGALYVMTGGTDSTTIRNVSLAAWAGHTNADVVTISQYCTCANVQSSCSTVCADTSVPVGYTRIQASTVVTTAAGARTLTAEQLVRTR